MRKLLSVSCVMVLVPMIACASEAVDTADEAQQEATDAKPTPAPTPVVRTTISPQSAGKKN